MKLLITLAVLLVSTAQAAECTKKTQYRSSICVGDKMFNGFTNDENELFGTVVKVEKNYVIAIGYNGKSFDTFNGRHITKEFECVQYGPQKVCLGDTVTLHDHRYNDEKVRIKYILESEATKDTGYYELVGVNKNNKIVSRRLIVLESGRVPGYPELSIGDYLPDSSFKIVSYIPFTDKPFVIQSGNQQFYIDQNHFKARMGQKEINLEISDSDYYEMHMKKKQTELYAMYKEQLHKECQSIFAGKKIEVDNVLVNVKVDDNSDLMIGAACLPIPIPWINKYSSVTFKAQGLCRQID